MIHNISRLGYNFLKVGIQNKASKNSLTSNLICSIFFNQRTRFSFSTQNTDEKTKDLKSDDFSPIDYYRNTIRRVNIRANGRGKFTPYFLQKIINMAKNQEHAKIMFQAYYNYLGHFTLIPNKVADSLVYKSIQIGNLVERVLQIFANHNYLAYFPHYDATNRFIKHLIQVQDQESLQKMFKIIIRSPLIKINTKTVDILTQLVATEDCQPATKEYVLKILLFRGKLVDGINQQDLLSKVAAFLQKTQAGPFQAKPMVRATITQLLEQKTLSTQDNVNRLILASTFGMIEDSGYLLAKQQQQIGSQHERYFNYVSLLYSRSSQQSNYGTILKDTLSEAKLSINNLEKLEQMVNGSSSA